MFDHGKLEGMNKVEEVGINGEIQMMGVRSQKKRKRQMEARERSIPQNNQGKTNIQYTTIKKEKDIVQLQQVMGMVWLDRIDPWTISFQCFVHLLSRLHRSLFVFFVEHCF